MCQLELLVEFAYKSWLKFMACEVFSLHKLQGGLMVISRWMEDDTLKGFLVADTQYQITLVPLEVIRQRGFLLPYHNAQYDSQYQTLVGTHGASLTDYPTINSEYVLKKGNGIVVMTTVLESGTGKPIGVVAFNGMGTRFNLSYKKLIELSKRYACCNFDIVVDQKYGQIAVRKDGTYFDTVEIEVPKVKKTQNDTCVTMEDRSCIPVVGPYNIDSVKTSEFNKPAQTKLIETMLNMSKLTPYYYTVLQAIRRLPAPIGTMGVTENVLYYDMKFVSSLSVPELTFVLIHEIMHLAMQHPSRFGTRVNHDIWNIACDLYINSIICNDFKCQFGKGEVSFKNNGSIKTPDFGVYIETIGEKIDLSIDTPETIYDKLMRENNNGFPSGGSSGNRKNSQQGQSQMQKDAENQIAEGIKQVLEGSQRAQQACNNANGSQQAGQDIKKAMDDVSDAAKGMQSKDKNTKDQAQDKAQQAVQDAQNGISAMDKAMSGMPNQQSSSDMSPQEQMQRGLNQIQQGLSALSTSNQSGQGQPGDGSSSQSKSCSGQPSGGSNQKGQQKGQGSGAPQESSLAEDSFDGSGGYESVQQVNVVYNGKKLTGTIMRDVMSNNGSKKAEDVQQKLEQSRKALQGIKTKLDLEAEERGEALEKNAGEGAGLTKRYIEVGLSAGVDWRVLFRNICKDKPKKTFTLAQPNQDFMNMGMTIADRRRIGKPEHVSHVKFAVDVSGSVTQKELMVVLSEIGNIFNHFKLDGELIYWSTMIGDAGMFSSLKDMLKVQPESTGGTDARCVFDYLSGKTKVHGVAEKDRIRDMKAVFIITDGCFSMNFTDYANMFGKRVVWLITGTRGNTITFNPPFGRVLGIELDND